MAALAWTARGDSYRPAPRPSRPSAEAPMNACSRRTFDVLERAGGPALGPILSATPSRRVRGISQVPLIVRLSQSTPSQRLCAGSPRKAGVRREAALRRNGGIAPGPTVPEASRGRVLSTQGLNRSRGSGGEPRKAREGKGEGEGLGLSQDRGVQPHARQELSLCPTSPSARFVSA
jgi:hypothetical protein